MEDIVHRRLPVDDDDELPTRISPVSRVSMAHLQIHRDPDQTFTYTGNAGTGLCTRHKLLSIYIPILNFQLSLPDCPSSV